jgi:hypothetical protein
MGSDFLARCRVLMRFGELTQLPPELGFTRLKKRPDPLLVVVAVVYLAANGL